MKAEEALELLEKGGTLCLPNKYCFDFMRELEKVKSNIHLVFKINHRRQGITDVCLSKNATTRVEHETISKVKTIKV